MSLLNEDVEIYEYYLQDIVDFPLPTRGNFDSYGGMLAHVTAIKVKTAKTERIFEKKV